MPNTLRRFNVNNGFYVADHTLEEVHQMTDFYGRNFRARIREQLTDFDPIEADRRAPDLLACTTRHGHRIVVTVILDYHARE